ncbi:hypothetical protein CSV63_07380 [Sporosarcina sp. P34]|uniref:hypothetical protein n=1 Tax=Sporosarcina sp. P34 TaxID=2048247 RepID=UPI000C16F582|nr:hypothetical protein [Sporosarcina sp. P34]PID15593.1 hypothetical protein CSV63_07380 [Sporosarcina sp. P34]
MKENIKGMRRKCIRCKHEGVTYTNDEVVAFCPVCDGNYVDLFRWGTVNTCANKKPDKRPETKIAELEKRIEVLEKEKQSGYTIDNVIINVKEHVDVDRIAQELIKMQQRGVRGSGR